MTCRRAPHRPGPGLALLLLVMVALAPSPARAQLRPPSVPLVAVDPYFSIWSAADRLTDVPTKHWTGRPHRLTSFVRIDGKAWRVMGDEPKDVSAMKQRSVEVKPTRTVYVFETPGVELTLTFTTPALPDDLMVLSRPVTYLTWDAKSADGLAHTVSIYFDATAEPAVNEPSQEVVWATPAAGPLTVMSAGTKDQPILQKKGDDLRIDWGYFYVAAPKADATLSTIAPLSISRKAWLGRGVVAPPAVPVKPQSVEGDAPVMAVAMNLGRVEKAPVSRWLMLAYDDLYSIQYFGKDLRPYWRRTGMTALDLLAASARDYDALRARCEKFDDELVKDLTDAGGERYAAMCALAYRQALAGNKLVVDANGQPLLFPKENTSNGCIGTVDVIYPMAPQFLFLSPSLARAMLVPVLDYAASPRWRFPFAPHDLGTYPKANGQAYGGGEKTEDDQMPVEETANLLILVNALARVENRDDFPARYWPLLTRWAEYLKSKGFDPENQLCTDDFAGHLAHNVNLSAKAIVALGAYGQMAARRRDAGRTDAQAAAAEYPALARDLAARWVREADDGDHFRLTFDKAGTWSQKYNVAWDRLLGLDLFPADALKKEMAFYRRSMNRFGLPLDSRKDYAKIDWTLWTATLTASREDFDALVGPAYDYLYLTPDRVPVNDLYWTSAGREAGMHARPVVGAFFLKMLGEKVAALKWASRDTLRPAGWAAFPDAKYVPPPVPDKVTPVVPTADVQGAQWLYTTTAPGPRWSSVLFKATGWKLAWSGFGTPSTPGAAVRTIWNTADIWLRREVTLPAGVDLKHLYLVVHHDEDVEIYINGVLAAKEEGFLTRYEPVAISPQARAVIRPGRNLVAVHCHQSGGGQFVDVGLATVTFK
jgi:hypothetical protein